MLLRQNIHEKRTLTNIVYIIMKRHSFLACLLLCCVSLTVAAKDIIVPDTLTGGIYPYEKGSKYSNAAPEPKESHWVIYVPMGMTFADMDESNGAKLGSGLSDLTVNLGIGVEYDFTPIWGVQLEFMAANYGKNSFTATKQSDGSRKAGTSFGNMYNMAALLSFDFMDAFFPKRRQTIFNLYANLGGGIGVFTYTPESTEASGNFFKPVSVNTKAGSGYGYAPFLAFGLLADFNITRTFSMGIRGMYDYYMSDLLDGPVRKETGLNSEPRANSNNDGLFTADLVLRWKINAKERSHVSNGSERMIADAVAIAEAREEQVHQQAEEIRKAIKDTVVISHKDPLVVMNEKRKALTTDDYYFVYFGNDKYSLDDQALVDVQKVAFRLEQDSTLCLELAGFADNTGSSKRNEELAKRRSEAVRDMLVNVYGIDPSRLLPMGKGQLTNVKSSFAPNRRVNMHVVTREQLEKTRQEVEEQERKKAEKVAEREARKSGDEATEAEAQTEKSEAEKLSELDLQYDHEKFLGVEVVNQKTTLSKLAREYYGNTNCWVYIYRTNRDVIKSPSYLWPNTKLYIPILSDDEKNITKEEALELMKTVK